MRNRLLIIISLTAAYIAVYVLLYPKIGATVNLLVIVPATLAAWLFGVRGGLIASVCAISLTSLLITLAHDPGLNDSSWQVTRLLGYGVLLFVTTTLGAVRELSDRLKRELIRREAAEQIEHQHNAELEAVHRASLQLSSSLELEPLLDMILTQISMLLHANNVHIFLYDGDKLTFGAALLEGQHTNQPFREPRPDGLTYTVVRTGQRLVIPKIEQHPLFQNTGWSGSMSGFPLSIRDHLYGVMNIAFAQPHEFSEGDLRIIDLLADQAAVAIRNAREYEQTRHHASELEQHVAERTAELQRAKENAEALLNNSFDVILLLSTDGLIKQTNPAFDRVFGTGKGPGQSFVSLFTDQALIDSALKSVIASHAVSQLEATALNESGEFTADLVFVPLESSGAGIEILCNLRDITARKRAEMRQRALSHGLRKVLVLTYELISSPDIDDLWKRAVELAREVLGVERCAIFIERDKFMQGTYGTNLQGESTDEHHHSFFKGENRKWERLEHIFALDAPAWEVEYHTRQEWDGDKSNNLPIGWIAVTPIHSAYRFIGIFYNDTAITNAPLDEIQQEIISMYCSFLGSLYEHKRVEEEVRRALGHEKELSELKSRFTSMISHELRTPLTSIQLSTDFLMRYPDRLTEETAVRHMEKIQAQVRHLTNLLEDVLIFTKVDQVGLQLTLKEVSLNAFCAEVAAEVRVLHPSHQITVENCSGESRASLDPKLMRQALMNLLLNAVKYSSEGSTITLTVEREDKNAVIRVADQGIGIPEADLERIFEVFYRARNVDTIPGTGLGLAIVRQVAEAHHGFIFCESQAGVGTTFTLRFPAFI